MLWPAESGENGNNSSFGGIEIRIGGFQERKLCWIEPRGRKKVWRRLGSQEAQVYLPTVWVLSASTPRSPSEVPECWSLSVLWSVAAGLLAAGTPNSTLEIATELSGGGVRNGDRQGGRDEGGVVCRRLAEYGCTGRLYKGWKAKRGGNCLIKHLEKPLTTHGNPIRPSPERQCGKKWHLSKLARR
ncbi:hypothetical protein BGZ63DRAFT_6936 [Mariannaea sp. PMI_226]|nr:hypothetical protein BGZ63DRAFT_6936 [Mariannaea sp. PMI_226]